VDEIENDDYSSQLRSLRLLLGKNFRPISTASLASLSGIDLVAIRGIEAGRRKLYAEETLNIAHRLGAFWDAESHQWVTAWDYKIPFSRVQYEIYSKRLINSETEVAETKAHIFKNITTLLDGLEAKEAMFVLMQIHWRVCDIAKENNVDAEKLKLILKPPPIFESLRKESSRSTPEKRKAKK
jgi:transcriptional regulator with XRE-family HTH domain